MNDLHISGSGSAQGGEYGNIRVSGSASLSGSIKCESIHVSGSARCDNLVCKNDAHISGSFRCNGNMECGELKVSGAAHFDGAVKGKDISISGAIHAEKSVEADSLKISGAVKTDGLLSAETVSIRLGGDSSVGSIGGSSIDVRRPVTMSFLRIRRGYILKAGMIEGDTIYLEDTVCDVVRGKNVEIGSGCKIGRVEYETDFKADSSSDVGVCVKN